MSVVYSFEIGGETIYQKGQTLEMPNGSIQVTPNSHMSVDKTSIKINGITVYDCNEEIEITKQLQKRVNGHEKKSNISVGCGIGIVSGSGTFTF